MSGTSMDGVDVSVISSDGYDQFTIILNEYFEYFFQFLLRLKFF